MPDAAPVTTATCPASPNAALVALVEFRLVRIGSDDCWTGCPLLGKKAALGQNVPAPRRGFSAPAFRGHDEPWGPRLAAAAALTSAGAGAEPAQPLPHHHKPGQHDQHRYPFHRATPVIVSEVKSQQFSDGTY